MAQVAIVYGSFLEDNSVRDSKTVYDTTPAGISVLEPVKGNEFDFVSTRDCREDERH